VSGLRPGGMKLRKVNQLSAEGGKDGGRKRQRSEVRGQRVWASQNFHTRFARAAEDAEKSFLVGLIF
ncbi:MAG: hypothetical protein V3W19_17920, partial [Desulfatiglandales bacterium]